MTFLFKAGGALTVDFVPAYGSIQSVESDFKRVNASAAPKEYSYQTGNPRRSGAAVIDVRELVAIKREELAPLPGKPSSL